MLSAYVLNASTDKLLASDGENALGRYVLDTQILNGHATEIGEKVDRHGTRCLVGSELSHHQRQMLAATLLAPGARDPLEHYMMSWQADEFPEPTQIDEAVDIFAEEMGYSNCQIVWATHSNTCNYHLHLVVNRIDLAQQKVVTPGGRWEIDRLHQVTALVEDAQGWSQEPNAIYQADQGEVRERLTGKLMRRADGSRDGCATRKKTAPEKSRNPEFETIAEALREARSWQDLHIRLSKVNAAYREKGSGAEIVIGKVRMKASDFGRDFSYGEMTKKLGAYTPDPFRERDPFEDYQAALRAERARVREAQNEALAQIKARRLAMKKKARAEEETYATVIEEARRLRCFDLAEAAVKKAFDRARATIAQNQLRREAWYKANCPHAFQPELPVLVFLQNVARDEEIAAAHGLNRRDFFDAVEYRRSDGTLAISDAGIVLVVDPSDRNAIAASLALAHRRGDFIPVSGPPSFQQVCREIAKARGYKLQLSTGELLHDPALETQNTRAEESSAHPVGGSVSSQGAVPRRSRVTAPNPKKAEQTKPVSRLSSSSFPRLPDKPHEVGGEDLSDEVLWAAKNGKNSRSRI